MQWLRRKFIAGFFVTVPLVISVAALVWVFRVVDGSMAPLFERLLGREVPGLGLLTTIVIVFLAGVIASNVIGKRILQRAEHYLLLVPVFRHIYAPIKQLIAAFSPGNEASFKRVVLVDAPGRGSGARLPDARVHGRSPGRPRPAAAGGRLRPDQSPLSRRHLRLPSRRDRLPRHHGGAGPQNLPDRRDGASPHV